MNLPIELATHYNKNKHLIKQRLKEFELVAKSDYFYELCFCICTPQSKAKSALLVQNKLIELDFFNNEIDVTEILRSPENYIRFHNQKAKRLNELKKNWNEVELLINSELDNNTKRNQLSKMVNGIGLKEASHFLRNIGFKGLGILDRHILRILVECNVYEEIPDISSPKKYFKVEEEFKLFANEVNIDLDEIDLLFWSYVNGDIVK
jgi:N-glycosylase/DNA lyase